MKKIWAIAFLLLILIAGCVSKGDKVSRSSDTGVSLWTLYCAHCHNAPPPVIYSEHEWDVVVSHMRARANLAEDDINKIRSFLVSVH